MNDTPSAPVPPAPGPRSGDSYKFTFLLAAGLLAAGAAYYFYTRSNDEPKPVDDFVVLKPFFAGLGKGGKLAPEYADTPSATVM